MNHRETGLAVALLGIVSILVTASFTMEFMARGMELHKTCPLDPSICPFIEFPWQSALLIGMDVVLVLIGMHLYRKPLPASGPAPDAEKAKKVLESLEGEEKEIYRLLIGEKGMAFQSKLIEGTGFGKVKVSRLLDIMENKGLLERKRRGMTNVVVIR